jgi:hypothetical protein
MSVHEPGDVYVRLGFPMCAFACVRDCIRGLQHA